MQLDEFSDQNLVERVRAGDREAYEVLIKRYYKRLYGICIAIIADPHESQDLCQEAMLQGYININYLRNAERFGIWITEITKNLCFDWLRKQKQTHKFQADLVDRAKASKQPDSKNEMTEAITKLPLELRMPLLMYYFDGRNIRSISKQLGVSHSSLWRRLRKAKSCLHELLTER